MIKFYVFLQNYLRNKSAATAIEYGLIACGIALAIVASVFTFGSEMTDVFEGMEATGQQLDNAAAVAEAAAVPVADD